MGLNLSDPCVLYKSLRHLVDAATTHYFETIPNKFYYMNPVYYSESSRLVSKFVST